MKKVLYGCLAILLIIAACKDEPKDADAEEPSERVEDSVEIESVDTVLSAETIQSFSTHEFTAYVRKKSPDFDWGKFRMSDTWEDNTPVVTPFNPDKDFFLDYGPFLKYSPDSAYFIDLDSYNVEIKRDGKGGFTGRELGPDTEISLIDVKAGKKRRLLFTGPQGSVEDGLWVDKNTLVLIGVQDNGDDVKRASLWRYDVPTHTFYEYEYNDASLAQKLPGYRKEERLKKVKIQ